MKKRSFLALLLLAALGLGGVAHADLLIFPPHNEFFEAHESQCVEMPAVYEAIEQDYVYDRPDGEPVYELDAGEACIMAYIYQDAWAIDGRLTGWIRLSGFRRLYDERDFLEDHREEICDVRGEVIATDDGFTYAWDLSSGAPEPAIAAAIDALEADAWPIRRWTFPGSGECYFTHANLPVGDTVPIAAVYLDGEGRLWGREEMDDEVYWLCLSQPSDRTIPATAPRYAEDTIPPTAP